jgi:electron transfer flavoprotein beta subunit
VVAITVGSEDAERALVHCLAMGADRAVRVALDGHDALDPLQVGQLLAAAVQPEQPNLVLCGAQSSDAAHGATGAVLAAVLGLPCATIVKKVEFDATAGVALVQRELEGGVIETAEIESPAVLTIQTGINEPRYVTLRAVNQARRTEIPVIPGETARPEAVGFRIRRMYVPARGRAEMIRGNPRAIAERVAELIREATV